MKKVIYNILIILLLVSCSDIIEYSPYQVKTKESSKYQNSKNLVNIKSTNFTPFKIALIADSHNDYDELIAVLKELNKREDYDFIIHLGDFTNDGLYKEYELYSNIINISKKPIITVIGNHDCRLNGKFIYDDMFGVSNFTFDYNNCKFVIFNNITWGEDMIPPDYEWFNLNLKNDKNYYHVIPFSHLPPWDERFEYAGKMTFNYILDKNNIKYSFHGHDHYFAIRKPYVNILGNVAYVTLENIEQKSYFILTIEKEFLKIEKIEI